MRKLIRLALLVAVLAGCGTPATVREVHLADLAPSHAVPADASLDTKPIRVAAASMISPQETVRSYGVFFAYLEEQIGRPIELVQRQTYEETYDLLRYGTLDVAMVCTLVYTKGHDEIGLELLAAPEVSGRAQYRSLIIARADSGIRDWSDLEGKRFAFTDPLSTSGRVYPLSVLSEKGLDPGSFFASTTYTYSHDKSIKAVVQGVVDAAAVDSLVYDQWVRQNPDLGVTLHIVDKSEWLPSPPLVVSERVDPALKESFRRALLTMHENARGKEILDALGVDRFVALTDEEYDAVRAMVAKAGVLP
ncbi:substrate-binding domain-containing protein [Symbiobacterium terraclitae]|uniref:substrate-binding domain-containing protein n=1 Tax=Symbiobacterium terraclitae TaxID=557451 RepID=UPI0035B56FAF